MAEASRRASFWLSLATDWICCACRARSAAASWSRCQPSEDWLAITATMTARDRADAPRSEPPQRAAVEIFFLGQQTAQHAAGVIGVEAASQMVGILGQTSSAPLEACRITGQTLTGNRALNLNPDVSWMANRVSIVDENALKTARGAIFAVTC